MASERTAFLFQGQGSQLVGMGSDLLAEFDFARQIFDMAEEIAKAPIRRLCKEGPLEELTRTANCQVAVTAVNLAVLAALERNGALPDAAAGHSLGEFSALRAAGVLTDEEALRLVARRGFLMDREAGKRKGVMAAVIGLPAEKVAEIVKLAGNDGPVVTANLNAPGQTVISGSERGVDRAAALAREAGGRALPLNVAGAWHSPFMDEAAKAFADFLSAFSLQKPRIPLALNVTGALCGEPSEIARHMAVQMVSPVRWEEDVRALAESGVSAFLEAGPKTVLSGLAKKILPENGPHQIFSVGDLKSLEKYLSAR